MDMDNSKIIELFHSKDFLEKFNKLTEEEEVINLLKESGIDIDKKGFDELYSVCDDYINKGTAISDDELSMVAAGLNINKNVIIGLKDAMEIRI